MKGYGYNGNNSAYTLGHIQIIMNTIITITAFYICDYFQISSKDFFDESQNNFYSTGELIKEIRKLTGPQVQHLLAVIKDINHSH